MNTKSCLHQIEIIEGKYCFDLEIINKRDDIKGEFFIREDKKLFILNGNKIFVYNF